MNSPDLERKGYRFYFAENTAASVIYSLGTGNFLAGLLSWMGATPAECAVVAAFPQLGCILQLFSPLLFERLHSRKKAIILFCFLFRFCLGMTGLIPLLLPGNGVGTVTPLFLAAYLFAGFVTPGLNQWILDLAPQENRGRFFARRDILSSAVTAAVILVFSRGLDRMIACGQERTGYLLVYGTVTVLSFADAVLLLRVPDRMSERTIPLRLRDLFMPFRNRKYLPVILFFSLWYFVLNLSSSFLNVYMLTQLGMEHGMIALTSVISTAFGICMAWVWGRYADRVGWNRLLQHACILMCAGYLGWFLLPAKVKILVPLLQCVITAGSGAYSMAYLNIQYLRSPAEGKTVYLGVTSALANLIGYGAVCLGAAVQPVLARHFSRAGIPVLFACTAAGFVLCMLAARKTGSESITEGETSHA